MSKGRGNPAPTNVSFLKGTPKNELFRLKLLTVDC
jgi:hypothetical protein